MVRDIDRSTIHALLGVCVYVLNIVRITGHVGILDTDERHLLDTAYDLIGQLNKRTDACPF